jgi:hypothetical protein
MSTSWGVTFNSKPVTAVTQNGFWTNDNWVHYQLFYSGVWSTVNPNFNPLLFYNQQDETIYDSNFFYTFNTTTMDFAKKYFYITQTSIDPSFVYDTQINCYTDSLKTYVYNNALTITNKWVGPLAYHPPSTYIWNNQTGLFTNTITSLDYDSNYNLVTVLLTPNTISVNTVDLGILDTEIENIVSTELLQNYTISSANIETDMNIIDKLLFNINHWVMVKDDSEEKRTHLIMSIIAHLCPLIDNSYMYLVNRTLNWISKYVKPGYVVNVTEIIKSGLKVAIRKGVTVKERFERIFLKIKRLDYLQTALDTSLPTSVNFIECF